MLLELEKGKGKLLQNKNKLGWNKTLFQSHCLSVKLGGEGGGGQWRHPRTPLATPLR